MPQHVLTVFCETGPIDNWHCITIGVCLLHWLWYCWVVSDFCSPIFCLAILISTLMKMSRRKLKLKDDCSRSLKVSCSSPHLESGLRSPGRWWERGSWSWRGWHQQRSSTWTPWLPARSSSARRPSWRPGCLYHSEAEVAGSEDL